MPYKVTVIAKSMELVFISNSSLNVTSPFALARDAAVPKISVPQLTVQTYHVASFWISSGPVPGKAIFLTNTDPE